jgi:hypothetical protein
VIEGLSSSMQANCMQKSSETRGCGLVICLSLDC